MSTPKRLFSMLTNPECLCYAGKYGKRLPYFCVLPFMARLSRLKNSKRHQQFNNVNYSN